MGVPSRPLNPPEVKRLAGDLRRSQRQLGIVTIIREHPQVKSDALAAELDRAKDQKHCWEELSGGSMGFFGIGVEGNPKGLG